MFNKVSELLENNTISKEAAEAIDSEITVALSALRDENKTLRTDKDTLSKSYDEVLASKNGLDEQLKGLDDAITKAKAEGKSEIVKQLEDERSSKGELQKSLDNLQKANTGLRVDSAVSTELDKFDVKKEDREMVHFYLRSKASMTDDGIRYVDGENSSTLTDAFGAYFKDNGSRLNAQGNGNGSGANGGGGGGGQKTISRADFEKLDAGKKAEAAKNLKIEG